MILLIDIGNTATKIALVNEISKEIKFLVKFSSKDKNWVTNIRDFFYSIKTKIENIVISNVIPKKKSILLKIIKVIFNINPVIIGPDLIKFLSLKINLHNQELGSDLIALAVGSNFKFGDCIVISLGTAITYNVIKNNTLKGVIIGPGFNDTKNLLISNAYLINSFNITKYKSLLGTNTNHALSVGFGNGFNYMIDGTIKAINQELEINLPVVITGGDYQLLKPFLDFKYQYENDILMLGLIIIYQTLKKKNQIKKT